MADDIKLRNKQGELEDWKEVAAFIDTLNKYADSLPPSVYARINAGLPEIIDKMREDARKELKALREESREHLSQYEKGDISELEFEDILNSILDRREKITEGFLAGVASEYREIEEDVNVYRERLKRKLYERREVITDFLRFAEDIEEYVSGEERYIVAAILTLVSKLEERK